MVHKSTKDPYVRFWIEGDVEVAMCTAADFREAMNERDRLRAALQAIVDVYESQDAGPADLRMAAIARQSLGRDKDG